MYMSLDADALVPTPSDVHDDEIRHFGSYSRQVKQSCRVIVVQFVEIHQITRPRRRAQDGEGEGGGDL